MNLFKILKDLEYRAVGVDPSKNKLPEGFFVSFRSIGLPIREDDYEDPMDPFMEIEQYTMLDEGVSSTSDSIETNAIDGIASGINDEDETNLTEEQTYLNMFSLSDDKLKLSSEFSVEPSTSRVSLTWESILTGATFDRSSYKNDKDFDAFISKLKDELDPELEKKIEKAESKLISAKEDLFEKYADSKAEGARGRAKWMNLGPIYLRKVKKAERNFRILKKRQDEIEALEDANGQDPAIFLISKAKTLFNSYQVPVGLLGNVPYTYMIPSNWYSPYAPGWNKYTENHYNQKYEASNSTLKIEGSLGLNLGIWNIGPKGGYTTKKESVNVDTKKLDIEFEYLIAKINRPWMDTSLLRAKNWFIKSQGSDKYIENCISDGTMEQVFDNKSNLFLPSVVTSLILIKNLSIDFSETDFDLSTIEKQVDIGGSIGIGPFKIGGSYGKTSSDTTKEFSIDNKTLTMEGVQLVGYVSEILPASPHMKSM